ncbi:hypothetical protein A2Z22_01955 [Candidatus Woesebacteria bacterium RBG_16_34_12]|uniref:Uncharacterized protein n=1 Tax=Candidatus Woesebacteria bacterium RBG_16_34_12 TaxID=1802480 RepID=A0A1F7X9H5_9BACT|nr:MAG: hypothetical protein A2Z22_01955 [Candidatus Woesebacteria bacterium RBG_16_34_12]
MHRKVSKNKECKELKEKPNELNNKGLNNKGFREAKDISGKSPIHKAAALKNKFEKEQISEEVAIIPVDNELEKPIDPAGKKENEESVILRYKDSENETLLEKVFAYEKLSGTTIPLDFESDSGTDYSGSFILSLKKSEVDKFRAFMKDDFEEIPFETTDNIIQDVQSRRSNRAISIDKSIKANRVGHKENPIDLKNWSKNFNTLDLLGVDTGEV